MKVVLIGQPNSGKSTIFNFLAGFKVRTGNFPGVTVKYYESEIVYRGDKITLVDLPGIYSLYAMDPAEEVARDYLLKENIDVIVNVVDASVLSRSLEFTIELMELGKPMILCLNMMDEAEKKGLQINDKKLSEILGIPVVKCIASRGYGLDRLMECVYDAKIPKKVEYQKDVEEIIDELEKICGNRLKVILYLEGIFDCKEGEEFKKKLEEMHGCDCSTVMSSQRHALAMHIFESCVKVGKKKISRREKIDSIIMHPVLGYIILFIIFTLFLSTAFYIGDILSSLIVDPLEGLVVFPESIVGSFLNGLWGGVVGALGIVVPYLIPLLLILSFLDDVGYMARAAYLLDNLFHKIGLHGKAAGPFLMGYGCTVPAIMATRILDERDRVKAAILLPMIPCSARSVIILAVIGGIFGTHFALLMYFINILVVFLVGGVLAKLTKRESPGMVMEMPDLKIPSAKIIWKKTYFVIYEFFREAFPLLVLGSGVFGILEFIGITSYINSILSPYVAGVLGLPPVLGVTLIFGILRKELALYMTLDALNVSYPAALAQVMSTSQILTFVLFITFYIPCLSTIVVMGREFNWKIVGASIAVSIFVATIIGFAVRFIPF